MSICAVAKKRLAFHDDKGSFITVRPGEFVNLPDYVRKDPMFSWAVKDGSLQVSEQVISPAANPWNKAPAEDPPVENPGNKALEEGVHVEKPATKKTTRKAAEK